MIKAIVGLSISLLACALGGLVLGFWKLYDIAPLWLFIISLCVFGGIVIAQVVLILRFISILKKEFEYVVLAIKDFMDWLKSLSAKEIIKIILGLLKK